MEPAPWQWTLLALGAFATGLSKTGVAGLGVLAVALFANALPARASTGALLPLLLCADVFGVSIYRKHAEWGLLWKLFPWVLAGIGAGCFALGRVSDPEMRRMIGVILAVMAGLQVWRQRAKGELAASLPRAWWFTALTGMLAGFTTMTANAAGPVMSLYLLAMGLPKLAFVGTGAWFYMLVNATKVPFSAGLGLISRASLAMDGWLLIPMVPGALLGPVILRRLDQRAFEGMVLALTLAATVRLLFW